MTNLAVEYF